LCQPGQWEPNVVIVSAGFDALDSDELAGVSLVADDFSKMTQRLCDRLSALSKKPAIVIGLEGGYQTSEMAGGGNLQQAVANTVDVLMERWICNKGELEEVGGSQSDSVGRS
jgi:acetoin utilization deacetylase AcuC-like enzyme